MSKQQTTSTHPLTAAQIEKGENLPPRLVTICKEIEAKLSKLDTYVHKAADMSDSIKALLAEAKGYCNAGGLKAFLVSARDYETRPAAQGRPQLTLPSKSARR